MESRMTVDFKGILTITGDSDSLGHIMSAIKEALEDSDYGREFDIDDCIFDWECTDSR